MTSRGRRPRHGTVMSAAAFAALFGGTACGGGGVVIDGSPSGSGVPASTSTAPAPSTTAATAVPPPTPTVGATTTSRGGGSVAPSTSAPSSTQTTTTYPPSPYCRTGPDGTTTCAIPGRPLRRRRWWRRRRELLLPDGGSDVAARTEYASVASFGELSLRLIGVGAPVHLVAACHQAALDEIRHATSCEALAGSTRARFGAMPALLGRRIGARRRARADELGRIAADSYVDGWRNERAAADDLRRQAAAATSDADRAVLQAMAADEDRHAELARSIVSWCFDEAPVEVSRRLAAV